MYWPVNKGDNANEILFLVTVLFFLHTAPFKTYAQMIEIMRKRHIVIEDTVFAKMALENFSYYSLVNGYKNTFLQIPKTDESFTNSYLHKTEPSIFYLREIRHHFLH